MGTTGLTLADLPNIFIMIGALVALFVMLVILLRNMEVIGIVGEGREDTWPRAMQPPRLLMQRVHIPFTFKLQENKPIGYSSVSSSISSTVRYWHASWWGAPVRDLHQTLWGTLPEILASKHLDFTKNPPHDEQDVKLSADPLQLGPPPRTRYPLVVILARDQRDTTELRPDDTVALITVVHIRDEQCPLPSGIIAQYLKQANGHLSCLKQLYVSGEVGDVGGDVSPESCGGFGREALCCVCASAPLSRALLPCRHACLCARCLPKLDKCPICRSPISSYFCIRNEEEPLSDLKQNLTTNRRILNLFHYH
ncbi:cell growth regulator with RING finger domain protein 1-like isoform X2 [Danaus plexippus]|uniref:cell growth regulator with RING finger domain protein 1-like isoform X2 n=1 Tax=Danaus plexippus TaxID=13037 RepID=UPI0013C4373B|nr:cell growth regulator with RING finger domain protein 1-like isoform X2 [Danaus plexippus]